jgi:YTH domain-containing family protein
VTNSRDTQELLPEAGHEMLRIFFTHPARTSLLQDFAFYELQSMQKQQQAQQQAQQAGSGAQSPQPGVASPSQGQQHPYAMTNPHAVPYQNMMPPMMQGSGYAPAPGVVQGVLRGASPALPMVPHPGYGGSAGGNGNAF